MNRENEISIADYNQSKRSVYFKCWILMYNIARLDFCINCLTIKLSDTQTEASYYVCYFVLGFCHWEVTYSVILCEYNSIW